VDIRRAADNVPPTFSSDETTLKFYDRSYFDRWYRDPDDRVATRESLERKARMVISLTEFLIGRRIRSVLDVGCGEALWYPIVKRLRPQARYIGVDSSDYVLERFGVSRNIRRGTLATLGAMRLPKRIDMIVCADVLQYAPDAEIVRGLRAIRQLLGGVAYIEAFVTDDNMEGDRVGWHERTAAEYSRFFRDAGLTQCGPYAFMSLDELDSLNRFEHL
jgi:SAM-dependent methyltransferase